MHKRSTFFSLYFCFTILNLGLNPQAFAESNDTNKNRNGIVAVTTLRGLISFDQKVQLLSTVQTSEIYQKVSSSSLKFNAKTSDGIIHQGYVTTTKIDHSPNQAFELVIPSQSPVESLIIFRSSDNKEIFNQTFEKLATIEPTVSLRRTGENEWRIPARNQGRRIVRRLEPKNKVLIFDLDKEDKIIEGIEGEIIEIQYQPSPERIEKILVKLR